MNDPKALIKEWNNRVLVALNAHYETARFYRQWHYRLGIPAALSATIVGTTVYATIDKSTDLRIKIAAGVFGVLAAVLTSLQTFLQLSERAEKHRAIATQYSSVGKELEILIATNQEPDQKKLDELRAKYDAVDKDAPSIPNRIRDKTREKYRQKET